MIDQKIPQDQQVVYEDEFKGPTKELRVLGAVCYFPFGFSLAYVLELNDRPFVLYHIKQGFVIFALFIVLSMLPISGSIGYALLLYLVLGAWHAYQAFKGKEYRMLLVQMIIDKIASTRTPSQQPTTNTENPEAPSSKPNV